MLESLSSRLHPQAQTLSSSSSSQPLAQRQQLIGGQQALTNEQISSPKKFTTANHKLKSSSSKLEPNSLTNKQESDRPISSKTSTQAVSSTIKQPQQQQSSTNSPLIYPFVTFEGKVIKSRYVI